MYNSANSLDLSNLGSGIGMITLSTNPTSTGTIRNGLLVQKSQVRTAGRSAIFMRMALARLRKGRRGVNYCMFCWCQGLTGNAVTV